jgi:hypothetical protein
LKLWRFLECTIAHEGRDTYGERQMPSVEAQHGVGVGAVTISVRPTSRLFRSEDNYAGLLEANKLSAQFFDAVFGQGLFLLRRVFQWVH